MGKKIVLGLDNGGTMTKAALYSIDGDEMAMVSVPVKPIMEKVGFVERDMTVLWQANARAVRQVIQKAGVDPEDIVGVAVTGHGNGAYFVDAAGEPVANGIISTDTRAKDYVEKWNQDGTYEKLLPKTMQIIWAGQLMPIIAWHMDHAKAKLDRVKWALGCKDYIRFCLTGEAYAELTDISVSSGLNLNTIDYDDEILDLFGIKAYKHILPPLKKCTDICGTVTEKAAKETGLIVGTPVVGGLCDVAACCIGTGVISSDNVCMVAGTWSINEFISKKPIISEDLFQTALYCIDDYWMILENSMTSASNLEWFVQNFMQSEKAEMAADGKSVFDAVNAMVASIETEDCPIIFLPFLYGTNVNADAKSCFMGMSGLHQKAHLLRAIYEGVAFSHRSHLENLLKFRDMPKSIRISGGAARSKIWVHIFSDVFQLPIEVSAASELGTMGAAMCAGIGSGYIPDFYQAADRFSKISFRCTPNTEKKQIYEDKFQLYRHLNAKLDGSWKKWDKIIKKH